MRSLRLGRLEIRRLLTGRPIVGAAFVVILLIPLLYGALYLWAFWDPYSRIDQVPVAVVNQDAPARSGDSTVSAGADLVDELAKKRTMRWEMMSAEEASAALREHRVYLALTIPRDFSASLASADTSDPVRGRLTLTANEADNMLASQIGARVMAEVRSAAGESASRGYFETMFSGVADARGGMSDAASGAVTLADGLGAASSGSRTLAHGLATARAGSGSLAAGLHTLAGGATALRDGAGAAASGARTLAGGIRDASDGASALDGGVRRLAGGLGALDDGLSRLAAAGPELATASHRLATGAGQVDAGVKDAAARVGEAAGAARRLDAGAAQVAGALAAYAAANPAALADPRFAAALGGARQVAGGLAGLDSGLSAAGAGATRLAAGSAQVAAGATALDAGLGRYVSGVAASSDGAAAAAGGARTLAGATSRLSGGLSLATSGAGSLADGTARVAAGSARLAAGAGSAADGSHGLAGGVARLSRGAASLSSGLAPAASGSRRLADGLSSGVAAMPDVSPAERETRSKVMGDPVALTEVKRTEVRNYGTGFAPYFIPLALWIGALMSFFIVDPLPGRALASNTPDIVVALAGYWPAALMGALQAVMLLAVVQAGLGLAPLHPVLTYGVAILTALAFIAIMQWLTAAFGPAGKLGAIVGLMLQLTSAAGTFPLETVPRFFQAVHPYLPMTYVVEALRQTIAGGDLAEVARCAAVLAVFLLVGLAGSVVTAHRRRIWTMDRLRPALDI